MFLKSLAILGVVVIVAINAATIQQRDIPVKIVYEEVKSRNINAVRNLDEKVQIQPLTPEKLVEDNVVVQKEEAPQEEPSTATSVETTAQVLKGVQNLGEKVQLSGDEIKQSIKHLPVQSEVQGQVAEETVPEKSPLLLVEEAQELVSSGLKNLRNMLKSTADSHPNGEQWDNLERDVHNFIEAEKSNIDVKQNNNNNIIQTIASGFQNITNNFVQNIQGGGQGGSGNGTNLGDEQQPAGPFQAFQNNFQSGINTLISGINNIGQQGATTSSTVLGDTGTATTQAPGSGFISNIVSNVQSFFNGNQISQGGGNGTVGDEGTGTPAPPSGPVQIIQSFGSQIGTAFNQFVSGGTTKPPGTSGDEQQPGNQQGPIQIVQGIQNQIGNAFNQFIGQTTSKPAGASGDENVTPASAPTFVQNIGSAIQNLIPGRPGAGGSTGTDNPIAAGIQNANNQVQNLVGGAGGSGSANPIQSIQSAVSGATGNKNDEDVKPVVAAA